MQAKDAACFSLLSQQLSTPNCTKCESDQSNNGINQPKQGALLMSLMEKQQQSGKLLQEERKESCMACLVTGMAMCASLSLCIAKLTLLEVPNVTPSMSAKVATQHCWIFGCVCRMGSCGRSLMAFRMIQ